MKWKKKLSNLPLELAPAMETLAVAFAFVVTDVEAFVLTRLIESAALMLEPDVCVSASASASPKSNGSDDCVDNGHVLFLVFEFDVESALVTEAPEHRT